MTELTIWLGSTSAMVSPAFTRVLIMPDCGGADASCARASHRPLLPSSPTRGPHQGHGVRLLDRPHGLSRRDAVTGLASSHVGLHGTIPLGAGADAFPLQVESSSRAGMAARLVLPVPRRP